MKMCPTDIKAVCVCPHQYVRSARACHPVLLATATLKILSFWTAQYTLAVLIRVRQPEFMLKNLFSSRSHTDDHHTTNTTEPSS